MNCRTFRKSHVDFVDGLLNDRRAAKLYGHMDVCDACARLDTAVRRGLLVARNLPQIQPSQDFMSRLQTRLRGPETQWSAPVPARAGAARILIELGLAVAVAVGVVLGIQVGGKQPPRLAAPRAEAVAGARAVQDIPRRAGGEDTPNDSRFNGPLATVVPVLVPGMLASAPVRVNLVDAASQAASLSP